MNKTILIIEDNADIRENTAELLGLSGYTPVTAENGKKGVETALREKPALIICDIMMPELDGYGVLHLLRKNSETEKTPFIFLTAKTERIDFRRGMDMGADDYLTKPFEEIELLNAIETRLKKSTLLNSVYGNTGNGLIRFLGDVRDQGFVAGLGNEYEVITLAKKQSLYQEGRRPRWLFYLLSGKIKCFTLHEDGKEYITSLHGEGEFAGYTDLFRDKLYSDSSSVLEEAEIMQIPKEDFSRLLNSDPSIAAKFIQILAGNVRDQEARLLALAYGSLRSRVAEALVNIVEKFSLTASSAPIEVSREELAQYVGTATESLIRTLSDFKSEKRIEIIHGRIFVKDPAMLKNLPF